MGADALRHTEVDGVPVYWVAGEGRLQASLWFRAGMVDERLPTAGRLHLIEHLALHGRESIRTPVNGQVSLLHTAFAVAGEPDEVTRSLADVCAWLTDPDWGAIDHERRVLQAESARRSAGPTESQLFWRYGAQGPGLVGYEQFGLGQAGPESLAEWLRTMFVRGNAGLALTGPPPAGLRLLLPDGPRVAVPAAVPCEQHTPAAFPDRLDGVALSGVVRRSTEATVLAGALQRELHAHFRTGSGVGYSAWQGYEPVDAAQAVLLAGIDLLPEAVPTATDEAVRVLRRLMTDGVAEADLRDQIAQQIAELQDDPAGRWQPAGAIRELLAGRPVTDRDQMIEELRRVTPAGVRDVAKDVFASLLISADPAIELEAPLSWLRMPTVWEPAGGDRFRSVRRTKQQLRVTGHGVYRGGEAIGVEARFDDLAAMVVYPDGGRALVRRDGYQLVVEPEFWRRGRKAIELIDAAAPDAVRVAVPARDEAGIPRPGAGRRRRAWHWSTRRTLFLLPVLAAASFAGGIAAGADSAFFPLVQLGTVLSVAWLYLYRFR